MNYIFDPTSNARLHERDVLKLTATGGYQPCLSPKTGEWFALQTWTGDTCTLDEVADDWRENVTDVIARHELAESLCARIEMMRACDEAPTIQQVDESTGHDYLSRTAAFAVARARGYTNQEVVHAFATLDRLDELAESTLGVEHHIDVSAAVDDLTVEAHGAEDDDAAE